MGPGHTMSIKAENKSRLLSILRSIDVVSPLGNDYRGWRATEPYAIAHLLSSLAEVPGALIFPLELSQKDAPDFVLSMGEKRVGIEHVEARSVNETKKTALRNREVIGPSVFFDGPVAPVEPDRSAEELRKEIIADDPKDGYGDQDIVDREWVRVMLRIIAGKEQKLEQYSRYDEDWLLIRDAWPFPSVNRPNATNQLYSELRRRNGRLQFHRVFVISREDRGPIADIAASVFLLRPRNDLWLKGAP